MDHDAIPSFRSQKYVWIRSKTRLDLLDIDTALSEIPVLVQEAGECTSIAIEIREQMKVELNVVEAQIAHELRSTVLESGKRRTDTAVASQIPLDENYKKKEAELSEARLDAALWQSLTEAVRTKSAAIRVAADLLNSGFLTSDHILDKRRKEIRNVKQESNG